MHSARQAFAAAPTASSHEGARKAALELEERARIFTGRLTHFEERAIKYPEKFAKNYEKNTKNYEILVDFP